jgi:hypothetical protein
MNEQVAQKRGEASASNGYQLAISPTHLELTKYASRQRRVSRARDLSLTPFAGIRFQDPSTSGPLIDIWRRKSGDPELVNSK